MSDQLTPLQQQTITSKTADWSQTVSFAQFDPSLGTLQSVVVGLSGGITGTVSLESLEATPSSSTVALPGQLSLLDPSGLVIAGVTPDPTTSVSLAGYDGTADFAGASGTTLTDLAGTSTTSATSFSDLSAFTGTGSVALTVDSSDGLQIAGPGNLQAESQASSSAIVSVQYDYLPTSGGTGTTGGGVTTTLGSAPITGTVVFDGASTTGTQTSSFADRTTGWSDAASFAQFDASLGTLKSVNISLTADLAGSVEAENLVAASEAVGATETATVTLDLPAGAAALSAAPSVTDQGTLGAYDGTADFAGGSGRNDQGLTATASNTEQVIDPNELQAFIGNGTVQLPIAAVGAASLNGPDALVFGSLMQAGATVALSYTYVPTDGGSAVTSDPQVLACFAAGTRIATPQGDLPVDALVVGQTVACLHQGSAQVVWLGHRRVDCRRHPDPRKVWPVRVRANAFGEGQPRRDLLLSPDHAVYAEQVLIPIKYLINRTTISQESVDRIEYFHIELASHDILFAEGLPAESFLDTGNKSNFANGGAQIQLYPDFASLEWEAKGCAPLAITGPALSKVRQTLHARATGARTTRHRSG
jgi:collagen type I/II/III/V/XI/XXIV/XXVII alpha